MKPRLLKKMKLEKTVDDPSVLEESILWKTVDYPSVQEESILSKTVDDPNMQEEFVMSSIEYLKKSIAHHKSKLEEDEKRLHELESQLARLRPQQEIFDLQSEGSKRKFEQKDHKRLIPLVRSCLSPCTIHMQPCINISSQHKRKLRSLVLNPVNDQLFVTSLESRFKMLKESWMLRLLLLSEILVQAIYMHLLGNECPKKEVRKLLSLRNECPSYNDLKLQQPAPCLSMMPTFHEESERELLAHCALDGIVNLWKIEDQGSYASLLSETGCISPKQRKWPEDIAWHPHGDSIYSAYTADGGDSQISILDLNSLHKKRVTFIEEKPHLKGVINNITFMPWVDICFTTGGSDHAVVLWRNEDGKNTWKVEALHRQLHSSAVMGVVGMQQKQMVISVGADKRIVRYDILAERVDYKHQIESKCMSVLANPSDFNLVMVQTGAPQKQLRLFDIRLRQAEIHVFGWKQESSESQSALINQAWSPNGLYISSGSADPMIHIFDIRYIGCNPSQSVKAHKKRVFKARGKLPNTIDAQLVDLVVILVIILMGIGKAARIVQSSLMDGYAPLQCIP